MIGLGLGIGVSKVGGKGAATGVIADPLQAIISDLNAVGNDGVFFIPQPQVLVEQRLWSLSDGTVPVLLDSEPVGRGDDLFGSSNNFMQANADWRPLYRLDTGLHSIYGDGLLSRVVSERNVPWLNGLDAEAFFAISFKREEGTGVGYVVHCDLDQTTIINQAFSVLSNASGVDRVTIGGSSFDISSTANAVVLYVQFNKSTGTGVISWNGGDEQPITVGARWIDAPMRLLARGGGVNLNGRVYGLAGVAGNLPFELRRRVMSYLAERAGLSF